MTLFKFKLPSLVTFKEKSNVRFEMAFLLPNEVNERILFLIIRLIKNFIVIRFPRYNQ